MTQTHPVFTHIRRGQGRHLIVADHASNKIPAPLESLGLEREALSDHIAWDIGTEQLAHALSNTLSCEAIISNVSRLVVDKNRRLDQPGLMPEVSDGIQIPGNRALSQQAIEERIDQVYTPYHAAIAQSVAQRNQPILLSLHSFTPVWDGAQRPWQCGFLYNQDDRLAKRAIAYFEGLGLRVGDNEPYPGSIYNATMDRHAEAHGHLYLMLEVRNDLLRTPKDITTWCNRVTAFLGTMERP